MLYYLCSYYSSELLSCYGGETVENVKMITITSKRYNYEEIKIETRLLELRLRNVLHFSYRHTEHFQFDHKKIKAFSCQKY